MNKANYTKVRFKGKKDNFITPLLTKMHTLTPNFLFGFKLCYVRSVSYTHLRAHETSLHLVCRLLLEKKNVQPVSYTHLTLPTICSV